jgi:hypothetical protein
MFVSFPGTSAFEPAADPPFRLQVSRSLSCAMFLVELSFVENLFNAFLISFPDISLAL